MQPHLATPRLQLTPARDTDIDALWTLWKDPLVRQFLWDDIEIDRERAQTTLAETLDVAPQGLGLWTIAATDAPGALVGCGALLPVGSSAEYYPPLAGAIELLVALAPEVWHRGYAQEALQALIAHATENVHLERLVAIHDVPNIASERLLRRLGFTELAETSGPRYRLRHYHLRCTPQIG